MNGVIRVILLSLFISAVQAEVPVPPLRAEAGGVVVLVCNEDPRRAPVYLSALPWDPEVVRWAVQRAEFVRELDYQTLLREPGEHYRLLQGLVEAKYRLERARISLMAGRLEEVTSHWEAARQAAAAVSWQGTERLLGGQAGEALSASLKRYRQGNPCGLVAARDRLEAAYAELSRLIEAGK